MFLFIEDINWTFIVIWLTIFIVTLSLELQTVNLTSIWFSISALVSLILAVFVVSPVIQAIVFLVLSLLLLIATKPFVRKYLDRTKERTNMDRVLGATAIVTKEITPDEFGEVKVLGALWRAVPKEMDTFSVGEKVIVEEISGVKLIVKKKNER